MHESDLHIYYVRGEHCGTIRKAHTPGDSLGLANTEGKDGSRSLYSVMSCLKPLVRIVLSTVMLVLQQEGLLRVAWRLERQVSSGGCTEEGKFTQGPIDRKLPVTCTSDKD